MSGAERVMQICDATSLSRLRAGWERLEPAVPTPIEHYEWSHACALALPQAGRPRILAVLDGETCRAIAPLAARQFFRLESIGVCTLTEPMDFVYADPAALARLCNALARQGLPLDLRRLREDSPVVDGLRAAFRGRGLVHVSAGKPYTYLEIDATWKEPEAHFNSGRRSDFRRAQRRAEKFGQITYEYLSPPPASFDGLLAEAYDAELNSWKGRNGTALAIDPVRSAFYRRYLRDCCEKGILRLAFMRIDGKAIGMQIAIESQQRLWLLKIGHNEEFSGASPGTLLMLHVARAAAESGLRSIEFLGSVEPWTQIWSDCLRHCLRVRVYPYGLAGLLAFSIDAFHSVAAKTMGRFRRAQT
jgi:CelD/BcsL family acetyltransferase involved in cellulose biosynthesis